MRNETERIIAIEGQPVQVVYRELPVSDVKLDPENPRIKYELEKQRVPPTQDDIIKLLLSQDGVNDLFKQIRDNKGLYNPILVDQNLRVVEGNCRTAIFKKLNGPQQQVSTWAKIPAYILPPDITETQIALLQSVYHITGKIKWPAYEKAAHLNFMKNKLGMDVLRISRALAITEKEVDSILQAYDTMSKEFLKGRDTKEGLKYWSYFQELFKRKGLEEFRKKPENIKLFGRLIKEKKIPRGEAVRDLPKVLNNAAALKKLKQIGMGEALKEAGKKNPANIYPLFSTIAKTRQLLEKLKTPDLEEIRSQPARQEELRKLYQAIKQVAATTKMVL